MSAVGDVFEAYELYRTQTGVVKRRGSPYVKRTPARERALAAMLAWCTEQRLDPYLWLYLLFDARHWRWAPKFNQLKSKRLLRRYPQMQARVRDLSLFRQARAVLRTRVQQKSVDIWTEIVGSVEQRKRYLVNSGQHEYCMQLLETETMGYHPRSLVCVRCPARASCADRLRAYAGDHVLSMRQQ